MDVKERIMSLYFKGIDLDQITRELLNEGIEINHDSICNILRSYTHNLRSIKSFNDIDSSRMSDKQKEFIKTIINDEKAKRQYKEYLKKATALKKEHIRKIDEITKPFKFQHQESDMMSIGLLESELLDLVVNGVTPSSLSEFIIDLEDVAISKHISVKTFYDNVVKHSKKDLEAMMNKGQQLMSESRAKKWLKDRRD